MFLPSLWLRVPRRTAKKPLSQDLLRLSVAIFVVFYTRSLLSLFF